MAWTILIFPEEGDERRMGKGGKRSEENEESEGNEEIDENEELERINGLPKGNESCWMLR
jgi:hypothetical protein